MNAAQAADLFDVLGVTIATGVVRVMAEGKTLRNAEAIEAMAVMRRGVEGEFFVTARAGRYRDGDTWEGNSA